MSSKTFLKKNIFQKFCSFFGSEKTSKQRLGLAAAAEYERERECVCALVCVCGREREKELISDFGKPGPERPKNSRHMFFSDYVCCQQFGFFFQALLNYYLSILSFHF